MSVANGVGVFGLCLLLAGCASHREPDTVSDAPAPAPPTAEEFPTPSFDRTTDIALLHNGKRLKVGDQREACELVFPTPSQSSRIRALPAGFPTTYSVRGYSLPKANEGFGAILYRDRVVVAMEQRDPADESDLDETVRTYQNMYGTPVMVEGGTVRYWFWTREPHTLMICAYRFENNLHRLTLAIGDTKVLDRLGISMEKAKADRDSVQQAERAKFGLPLDQANS